MRSNKWGGGEVFHNRTPCNRGSDQNKFLVLIGGEGEI